ncbi:MAG: hypothetical protein MJ252_19945 [archaeon]|nr:hypothetical protein [archaeon]
MNTQTQTLPMKRKYYKDWNKFVSSSGEFLSENMFKSRVTFKYRNKQPSSGKIYVTDDNKSFYTKLTEKNDLDKLDTFISGVLYMLANKKMEEKVEIQKEVLQSKRTEGKKKNKNKKK